ncbi:MAG: hypothetical protein OHK0024_00110 [Thalassobaculales bacterium]
MRSLLVALDETPAARAAMTYALALATAQGAAVTGIGVTDVGYLTAPEPGGIGSAHYKEVADRARLRQARERGERAAAAFLAQCRACAVEAKVLTVEGDPAEAISAAAAGHDAIVIGRDSDFHGEADGGLALSVERLLHRNPRPVVITPAHARAPSTVVIAYDGSVVAARTLQLFVLLGVAGAAALHVVSVAPEKAEAERRAAEAGSYLALYGRSFRTHAFAAEADPAGIVIAEAVSLGADLLVMGAYGHRGWKEVLLGSFTTRMLAECPTALFIHH